MKEKGGKKETGRQKTRGRENEKEFIRSENIFDHPLDDLMGEAPEDAPDIVEVSADEPPVETFDDEDLEERADAFAAETFFEREHPGRRKTKPAFLAIVEIGDERKAILQNLRFPKFADQKPDLETKAKLLKCVGNFIIRESRFLVDLICAGKSVPEEGNLGQKKIIAALRADVEKVAKRSGRAFSAKTLEGYLSKVKRFEYVELPDGKSYSLTHFLCGEGKKPESDEIVFLKFLSGREDWGISDLAREFINRQRIILSPGSAEKTVGNCRKRFERLKKYLRKHRALVPADWSAAESAEFYLSKRELPRGADEIRTVADLFAKSFK